MPRSKLSIEAGFPLILSLQTRRCVVAVVSKEPLCAALPARERGEGNLRKERRKKKRLLWPELLLRAFPPQFKQTTERERERQRERQRERLREELHLRARKLPRTYYVTCTLSSFSATKGLLTFKARMCTLRTNLCT